VLGCPPELGLSESQLTWIKARNANIHHVTSPQEAIRSADCVITDAWVSMHNVDSENRHNLLSPYAINSKLMALAKPDAIFMHCLPAHRGEEVTDEIMDGPRSVVFDEAENRVHAQKAVLLHCLS
jgi:ornithine carbamoyltransferase